MGSLRGSRWGWVARGDKAHPVLLKFPSDVSTYKDTDIIKQVRRCRSPLPEGNPVPQVGVSLPGPDNLKKALEGWASSLLLEHLVLQHHLSLPLHHTHFWHC